MKKKYYNILKKIEDKGFTSYIVGGYVRDFLLGKESVDLDIITNATPKDLSEIFKEDICNFKGYGSLKLTIDNQIIDITTFRRELDYQNGRPIIEYTTSLEEDLKRRDFLINTLVMDKDENIIDLLGGREDLKNKIIRTVMEEEKELTEDPNRILRALRFMTVLDFKLSDTLKEFIINNKILIKTISQVKKKEELDKIFKSDNIDKFFDYIKRFNLEDVLGIRVGKYVKTSTVIGTWAQIECLGEFPFTKYEKEQINEIKKLIKKGKIDKIDIYRKGLYISTLAGEILGISAEEINNMLREISIKDRKDIDITSQDICDILNIEPNKKLGEVLTIVEEAIVLGKLNNSKKEIINYIKSEA